MPRLAVVVAILAVAGCHSSKPRPSPVEASAAPGSVLAHAGPVAAARFSRPIAAIRAPSGVTLIAGLVVPTGVIAVTAIGPDGATRWTHDAVTGVSWSANATLNVFPARGGAVVVWRGLRGGQQGTVAAEVALDGRVDAAPYPVGAAACATDTELAWVDHGSKGTWLVKTRAFGGPASATALTLPEDRDPALLCGAKSVFALGDGDDDVTLQTVTGTAHGASVRVVQDSDFRGDEERGHEAYAVGDVLGLVRFGLSGSVAAREVVDLHPTPWRRFGRKLTESDDVALVDADAHLAVVAFTHVLGSGGDEAGTTVEAFAWERSGSREASYRLAPVDAAHARGPFWSGAVPGGIVVGWVERSAREEAGSAPSVGMAYRVVSLDGLGEIHRVERSADELVDAGCDDAHCYAVALARAAGEDGGQPEVAAVLAYP
jgi:hypothetical protein